MFKKVLFVCFIGFVLISTSLAQIGSSLTKTGTTSAQFLKIGIGARAIGMGGAFNSIADDISSIYWNPAGLSRISGRGEVIFDWVDWIMDIRYGFAAFALNLSPVPSGISTVLTSISPIVSEDICMPILPKFPRFKAKAAKPYLMSIIQSTQSKITSPLPLILLKPAGFQ